MPKDKKEAKVHEPLQPYCPYQETCKFFNFYPVCSMGVLHYGKIYEPNCVIYYFEERLKEEIQKLKPE